jgi:UDP-N-acetylbacillosamine N-acetyltransferase
MCRKVVIWGVGGHALVVADAIRSKGEEVYGFIDTVHVERAGEQFSGLTIWGSLEEAVRVCHHESLDIAIGFGHCAARSRLIKCVDDLGLALKTVIHANAILSATATIGRGAYIAPNAIVEAKCLIGDGAIVNAAAVVCHECIIGEAVSVCPGVKVGGKSTIGRMSWIGIGSTIIDKVCIGERTYIGAGSVVVQDMPDQSMAYGVPARVVRKMTSEF